MAQPLPTSGSGKDQKPGFYSSREETSPFIGNSMAQSQPPPLSSTPTSSTLLQKDGYMLVKKAEQIVQNFYSKVAHVIYLSRCTCPVSMGSKSPLQSPTVPVLASSPSSAHSGSSLHSHTSPRYASPTRKTNKWAKTGDMDFLKEEIKFWKQQCTSNPNMPPLMMDIYLDISQVDFQSHYLTLKNSQTQQRQRIPLESLIQSHKGNTVEFKDKILLETWQLSLSQPSSASLDHLAVVYKKAVTFFRSLYSYVRLLPAFELKRLKSKLKSVELKYRLSTTRIQSESEAGLDQLHIQDCRFGISEFSLGAVETPFGTFSLHVTYRLECDFSLEEKETLRTSKLADFDENYFSPRIETPLSYGSSSPGSATAAIPLNKRRSTFSTHYQQHQSSLGKTGSQSSLGSNEAVSPAVFGTSLPARLGHFPTVSTQPPSPDVPNKPASIHTGPQSFSYKRSSHQYFRDRENKRISQQNLFSAPNPSPAGPPSLLSFTPPSALPPPSAIPSTSSSLHDFPFGYEPPPFSSYQPASIKDDIQELLDTNLKTLKSRTSVASVMSQDHQDEIFNMDAVPHSHSNEFKRQSSSHSSMRPGSASGSLDIPSKATARPIPIRSALSRRASFTNSYTSSIPSSTSATPPNRNFMFTPTMTFGMNPQRPGYGQDSPPIKPGSLPHPSSYSPSLTSPRLPTAISPLSPSASSAHPYSLTSSHINPTINEEVNTSLLGTSGMLEFKKNQTRQQLAIAKFQQLKDINSSFSESLTLLSHTAATLKNSPKISSIKLGLDAVARASVPQPSSTTRLMLEADPSLGSTTTRLMLEADPSLEKESSAPSSSSAPPAQEPDPPNPHKSTDVLEPVIPPSVGPVGESQYAASTSFAQAPLPHSRWRAEMQSSDEDDDLFFAMSSLQMEDSH